MNDTYMLTDKELEDPLKFCMNYVFYSEIFDGTFYY